MRYIRIVTRHWLILIIVTLLGGGTAVGLSFIPTQLYESEVDVLIVQENSSTDSYTAQRAAEKLGNNLAQIIYSFDFLDRVIATGYVNEDLFGDTAKERQEEWQRLVSVTVVPESSLLKVFGYGTDQGKSEDVALGVAQVLTTNAADYHGAGDTVEIKHISGPITSTRPVKPNIPLNGVAGALLGFLVPFAFFVLRSESKQRDAEQEVLQYQLPAQSGGDQTSSAAPIQPDYRVLDEFPSQPFNFGSTIEDEDDLDDEEV